LAPGGHQLAARVALAAALRICQQDPIANVIPAARIQVAADEGWQKAGGELWPWPNATNPIAFAWAGAALVPVIPAGLTRQHREAALRHFATHANAWGQRCSSITGPAADVLGLWRYLKPVWPEPFAIRYRQKLLAVTRPLTSAAKDLRVRLTQPDELPALLPASIAMFTAEVGYSPTRFGSAAYQAHIAALIAKQRSYCIIEQGQVIFKADVAAVAGGVAQLQGVWLAPHLRGQGLAKPALSAVIADVQVRHAPIISLLVNHQNSRAQHIYQSLGFQQAAEFTTVLF